MIDPGTLTDDPGCYIFSDEAGVIIYIGKARNLKKRVMSYFQKSDHDPKTRNMIARIASVSVMVTNTETEALILENNLIKKHQPRYNIDLKDAKRFAYIELTKEAFPRIGVARRAGSVEATYFGPFVSAAERDAILRVIKRIFCLRSCRRLPKRACLRYHLKSCSAPCIGQIGEAEYRVQADRAAALLKGRGGEVVAALRSEMAERSARQDYEEALRIRDQIAAVGHLSERQHVERMRETDQDVIAYTEAGGTVFLMVFSVEKGRLSGKQEYSFDSGVDFFEEFLVQYYAERRPPPELILPHDIDGALLAYLEGQRGGHLRLTVPKIGEKKRLLDLVEKNIGQAFFKNDLKVQDLRSALALPTDPAVIECFDISHLSGTSMVGSMVQFRNGRSDKKNYRRFRIRTVGGIDDTASIAEIVRRRYHRLVQENSDLPDLIIVDGGKGQLSAAVGAVRDLGLTTPVIAIAKREEEVFLPDETLPLRLDPKGIALRYIQEIRDEAHRFAHAYHTLLRGKRTGGKPPQSR